MSFPIPHLFCHRTCSNFCWQLRFHTWVSINICPKKTCKLSAIILGSKLMLSSPPIRNFSWRVNATTIQISGEIRWRRPQDFLELLPRPPCGDCGLFEAFSECADCGEFFCSECYRKVCPSVTPTRVATMTLEPCGLLRGDKERCSIEEISLQFVCRQRWSALNVAHCGTSKPTYFAWANKYACFESTLFDVRIMFLVCSHGWPRIKPQQCARSCR